MTSNRQLKWIRNSETRHMERVYASANDHGDAIQQERSHSMETNDSTAERLSLLRVWRNDLGVDVISNDGSDLSEFGKALLVYSLPSRQLAQSNNHRNCTVCLEKFKSTETLKILPCHHEFHPECIDTWLQEKLTCPSCRSSLLFRQAN
eukprot:325326_1